MAFEELSPELEPQPARAAEATGNSRRRSAASPSLRRIESRASGRAAKRARRRRERGSGRSGRAPFPPDLEARVLTDLVRLRDVDPDRRPDAQQATLESLDAHQGRGACDGSELEFRGKLAARVVRRNGQPRPLQRTVIEAPLGIVTSRRRSRAPRRPIVPARRTIGKGLRSGIPRLNSAACGNEPTASVTEPIVDRPPSSVTRRRTVYGPAAGNLRAAVGPNPSLKLPSLSRSQACSTI